MRLIDADALIEELKYKRRTDREGKKYSGLECAISKVKKMPTIDSKTVVAKEIFAEIEKLLQRFMNEHDYSIGDLLYDVTELENKYIGGMSK